MNNHRQNPSTNPAVVKLRLIGPAAQVERLAELLRDLNIVIEESDNKPARQSLTDVRRYIAVDVSAYPCESCGEILPGRQLEKCPVCAGRTCEQCRCAGARGEFVLCQHCADLDTGTPQPPCTCGQGKTVAPWLHPDNCYFYMPYEI